MPTRGLHHRDEGQGPPVLLLHGLMASGHVFDPLIALGKSKFRFINVDLPNSGRSQGWGPMKPEILGGMLDAFLEEQRLPKVIVVGHSFGGLAGLALTFKNPARVEKLIVASTPAVGLPRDTKKLLDNPIADQGVAALAQLPIPKRLVRSYLGWLFGDPRRLTDASLEAYLQTLKNPGVWPSMLEATRSIRDYRLPGKSPVPAEVIWGDRDRLVPLVNGERLAITLDAGFTVLPEVGHSLPEEQPEVLLEAIDGSLHSRKAKERYPGARP